MVIAPNPFKYEMPHSQGIFDGSFWAAWVKNGKLDMSWKGWKPASVEQKIFDNGREWEVAIKDAKIKDKAKQSLYIIYSLVGQYIDANFTGN